MPHTLYYFHDPMCSWCWGFAPVWQEVREQLPTHIQLEYIVGGLAADSDEPMPIDMQSNLQSIWQRIQDTIPGTQFNFDFWTVCQPRRSTYPACRAVLAAKHMQAEKQQPMITAIQQAYYLQAKNPSNTDTLRNCAESIGLDTAIFLDHLQSPEINWQLHNNIKAYEKSSGAGFPGLILSNTSEEKIVRIDYNDASSILTQLNVNRE